VTSFGGTVTYAIKPLKELELPLSRHALATGDAPFIRSQAGSRRPPGHAGAGQAGGNPGRGGWQGTASGEALQALCGTGSFNLVLHKLTKTQDFITLASLLIRGYEFQVVRSSDWNSCGRQGGAGDTLQGGHVAMARAG
jgi:hypothetical protein